MCFVSLRNMMKTSYGEIIMNMQNNRADVKSLSSGEEREALSHAYKESDDCWKDQQREIDRNEAPNLKPARIK
jgi:hypothetical protein